MQNIINNVHTIHIEQKMQQAVLSYIANYTGFGDSEHQKLMEIFKAFDLNGDGQLEYHEIFEGYK